MTTASATLTNIRLIEDEEGGIVTVTCGDCAPIYANQDGLTIRALTTQDDRTRRNSATCQECHTRLDWTVPRGMELPPRGLGEAGRQSRAYTRGLGEAGSTPGRAY